MPHVVEHSFPAAHALQLVTLVKRWNIDAETLLEGLSLTQEQLEEPHARISVAQLTAVSERARMLTAEPGIGFYLGLSRRISNYGYLGFAAQSASTLREGLQLATRFTATVSTALTLSLDEQADTTSLTFHEHADLGSAHDIACFSFLVGMRQLVATMTGKPALWIAADVPLPEPEYFSRFSHLLPNVRFDQPRMRVTFETGALDVPLLAPDRAALRLAVEACERDLAALGFEHHLGERVRRAAVDGDNFRNITDVAKRLGMSTRTLKRKLAAQQLSYSAMIDKERLSRAVDLLRAPDRTLDEIAERLGYSSVANFTRAFRRLTQLTPTQYRKQKR